MPYKTGSILEGEYPQKKEHCLSIEIWHSDKPLNSVGFVNLNISSDHKDLIPKLKRAVERAVKE